ncbi:MAG: nuclear transport factor 2 family protein [Martelella sp.]|uniref:nuclear transport factor 2 family protein n=1 Tax=Martelella sp. TaxID=1969699 RepID=UPI0032421B49
MKPETERRLMEMLEREALFDLVRRERFARDQGRFDVMRECFHDDAYVRTSWYDGKGGAAYVDSSRAFMQKVRGGKHWVFPAYARINGDRATVESPAMIFNRAKLEDIAVDFHVFCRFFSRCVREDGRWKIMSFEVLFERDVMSALNPREALPIDWDRLESFRPSYCFLSYLQGSRGITVNQNLLGDDRPEELAAFHEGEEAWLRGA